MVNDTPKGTKFSLHNIVLYNSLGSLLRDYRQWRNLTQEKLSELISVGVRELRNWESGYRRASAENLHDIAEATGIPMQVCVALNVNQPIWYSIRKRMFMYSSIEEEQFYSLGLFKQRKRNDKDYFIKHVTISKDKHIDMMLSCHQDLYGSEKLIRRDVIKTAAHILPEHNKIYFDCWGHYVGHQIALPISIETYQELKKQKTIEDFLTSEMIVDIIALGNGVFFSYSTFAVNISTSYSMTLYGLQILSQVANKERFLLSTHTITKESAIILKNLDMKLAKDYKYLNDGIPPVIHEIGLDYFMRFDGPVGWMAKKITNKNLDKNFTKRTKQLWAPAMPGIKQDILPPFKKHKKNITGEIARSNALSFDANANALTVDQDFDALSADIISSDKRKEKNKKKLKAQTSKSNIDIASCPNTICALYGKTGKVNIVSNGTYRSKDGSTLHRFICKECGKSFCSRTKSIFYGLRSPEEKILEAIKLLAKGSSLRSVAEIIGVQLRTVRSWLITAAVQAGQNNSVNSMLIKQLKVTQIELDNLWRFAKNESHRQRPVINRSVDGY